MTVYEVITARILDQLDRGVVPWRRPWDLVESQNITTGKKYRGVNAIMLPGGWFGTFKQVKALGGNVKKGSHGFPVVFFSFPDDRQSKGDEKEVDKEKEDGRTAPIIRYYHVFRVEDCDGIDLAPFQAKEGKPSSIEAAESIVMSMPNRPKIRYEGGAAYYRPLFDDVTVPPQGLFSSPEEYYSTIFHELSHSTGHEKRLNRPGIVNHVKFKGHEYGKEELVAEFSASFLCGEAGIDRKTVGNSASYIDSWKRAIKADLRMVIQAAGQAQRAADYILGKKPLTFE